MAGKATILEPASKNREFLTEFVPIEMYKNAAEILVVLLNAGITPFVTVLQETQNGLLELAAAFAGDDLDIFRVLLDRLVHHPAQGSIDRVRVGKNIMQVEF